MTESISVFVGGKGIRERGGMEDDQGVQRNFWDDGYAHYLGDGDGFTGECV